MIDQEDALIDLLNGIGYQRGSKSTSKPFLDESGIPTDSFLQALKHGFSSFSNNGKQHSNIVKGNVESLQASSSGSRHHYDLSDSSGNDSDSDMKDDDYDSNSDYDYMPSEKLSDAAANPGKEGNFRDTKVHMDKALKQKSVVLNPERSRLTDGSHPPPSRSPTINRNLSPRDEPEPSHAGRRMSSTSFAFDDEAEVAKLGSDLKIKSLMLRITGQLQTIRVLEVQLGEAQGSLKQKCLEVAKAEVKLKQFEPKEKDRLNHTAKVRSKEDSRLLRAKIGADDNAARFKAQSDSLHAQLAEEETRRQRADERVKALKSYADKAKAQLREEESLNKDLRGSVEALTAKAMRLKRDCKELAVEAAAQRGLAAEKDVEVRRQVGKTEKVETALRQANNDIHVMREEARSAKIDAASTIVRLKAAHQELELLKERDAARRAEIRLQSLQDRDLGSTIQRVSMDSVVIPPLDRGRDTDRVKDNYKDFAKASRISPSPDAQPRNIDNYFSRGPGEDEYAISKSGLVSDERRASMATGSSTGVEVNSESRKEKEKYAQTHPSSSSTPSRRPHYSLPSPAPAHMPTSACASAAVRGVSSRTSQPRDRNIPSERQTFSSNRINAHITTSGDRASSDSEVNDKSVYIKKRSPKRESHKNTERNENTSAKLQLPVPSSAAQYFSDSELQHYEKHSKSSLARMMRYSEETSGTTRQQQQQQQQTVATAYPPRPPLLSTSDKRAENHSLHFPHTSSLKRNDDGVVPSNRSSLRFDAYVNGSSSRNGKDMSTAMESSKDVGRQSSMQDRAELLYNKNRGNRIISETTAPAPVPATLITSEKPIPDKVAASNHSSSSMRAGTKYASTSASASAHRRETEVLRSDRLQSMYDRVTSSSAPSLWRDSDSSESEDSDS